MIFQSINILFVLCCILVHIFDKSAQKRRKVTNLKNYFHGLAIGVGKIFIHQMKPETN